MAEQSRGLPQEDGDLADVEVDEVLRLCVVSCAVRIQCALSHAKGAQI